MNFALLAPLALGLLALLAGPVLAHMARREPNRKVDFGAMMLLRRVRKRLRRRRRTEDRWLMLLRLLAVLLAVLAATRPELRWPATPPPGDAVGPLVVVLDNSLSMDQRDGDDSLMSRARDQAVDLLREVPAGTRVGAVTIGGDAARLLPDLVSDPGVVGAALGAVQQTQGVTDLAGGLAEARRMLAGKGGRVIVFTDEAGSLAVPGAADELSLMAAQNVALEPRVVRISAPANAVVTTVRYGEGLEGGSVRFTVENTGQTDLDLPVTVQLPDGAEITAFVEVPAGGAAAETITVPRVAEGGVAAAILDDPNLPADNRTSFHLPRVGASRVLVVDGDPGPTPSASEVYFLERALAPWGSAGAVRGGVLPDVIASGGVLKLDPEVHRVVFVANLADPGPLAVLLTDFVRRGGGLVLALGETVTPDLYNGPLAPLLPSPLKRPQSLVNPGEDGVRTELPDTNLALFRPFARGGRASFGNARWRRLYALEPFEETDEVRTLLRTEGGMPLLVERKVGRGRVMLFTGTLDMGWGTLPLQSAYMPFVQRLVTYLGGEASGGGERMAALVGDTVPVALPAGVLEATVTGPGGPVAARLRGGRLTFTPDRAGAYVVETPGAPPLAWVAVNTDPAESDVQPGPSLVALAATIDPDRYQRRVAMGPWLLGGALVLALLQILAALALARRYAREAEAEDLLGDAIPEEARDAV